MIDPQRFMDKETAFQSARKLVQPIVEGYTVKVDETTGFRYSYSTGDDSYSKLYSHVDAVLRVANWLLDEEDKDEESDV